ncbi:hypothetical protein GCM10028791_15680 [Echinicola sediminis]
MMNEDFLIEMGFDGLTGRLKRLSDLFVYQTKEFYRSKKLDIEPNWHMIFLLLQKHKKLTVTEIAAALHISHPAVIKLVNKMKKKGYISSEQDPDDLRKFHLFLSEKAIKELPKLEEYWEVLSEALKELMGNDTALLDHLGRVEDRFSELDYINRTERILEKRK